MRVNSNDSLDARTDKTMDMKETLQREFQDPEYKRAYAEDYLNSRIATQLKVLREQRGWTQAELAERAGMEQSRISTMEDVNYNRWTISTLKRLAAAFDLCLSVNFETGEDLINDFLNFSRESLEAIESPSSERV